MFNALCALTRRIRPLIWERLPVERNHCCYRLKGGPGVRRLAGGRRSLQRTGLWKSGYGMGLIGLSEHFGQSKPGAVQPYGTHQN